MANIKQYVYRPSDTDTWPSEGINIANGIIKQLGIQSIPGLKFSLNNSKDEIMIGNTGIFELNAGKYNMVIEEIAFSAEEIQKIASAGKYLIIDIIYEENSGQEGND